MVLHVSHYTRSIDSTILFQDVSFLINQGDVVVLLGENGSGKSTLLTDIYNWYESGTGNTSLQRHFHRPNNVVFSFLPQLSEHSYNSQSIYDFLTSYTDQWVEVLDLSEKIFVWSPQDLSQSLSSFSGGEITKLLLAHTFLNNPDLVILDEPTNHLDRTSLQRLAAYIREYSGACLLVSHNREFVEDIGTGFVDISQNPALFVTGSFEDYRAATGRQLQSKREAISVEKKSIDKNLTTLAQKMEAAQKGSRQAVQKFNKGSIDKYQFSNPTKFSGRLEKMLPDVRESVSESKQKIQELKEKPTPKVDLKLAEVVHPEGYLFVTGSIVISAGERVLINDLELRIKAGDRFGIVGNNGTGKSLLARFIGCGVVPEGISCTARELPGHAVIHPDLTPDNRVYLDQSFGVLHGHETDSVLEFLLKNKDISVKQARDALRQFRFFTLEDVQQKVGDLSGGERARLVLASTLIKPLHLLVLDEFTNHLDFDTVNQIVAALREYTGALIVVSHDNRVIEDLEISDLISLG